MFRSLSIRARMAGMAACAVIALAVLFAIQYVAGRDVADATARTRAMQADIGVLRSPPCSAAWCAAGMRTAVNSSTRASF